jgi:hypothetical protein
MGRCLARSNADWRPDLVHEHVKKIRYKNSLSEARENIASLMEDIESLRFANEHLRSVVGEAQRAGRSPGNAAIPVITVVSGVPTPGDIQYIVTDEVAWQG